MKISALQLSQRLENSYHTKEADDSYIIEGILQNSEEVIAQLYHYNFIKIKRLVWSFKNTALDPDDIFQEGLTRAILNVRAGRFRGESSFATYLSSVCRNICLKQLSRKQILELDHDVKMDEEDNNYELISGVIEIKEQLNEKCRKIIDLRFSLNGETDSNNHNKTRPFEDIAEHLGITAPNARQRFKRCLEKLRELVSQSELNEYFVQL